MKRILQFILLMAVTGPLSFRTGAVDALDGSQLRELRILQITPVEGGVRLAWLSVHRGWYLVMSSELGSGEWTPVGSWLEAEADVTEIVVPRPEGARVYRVLGEIDPNALLDDSRGYYGGDYYLTRDREEVHVRRSYGVVHAGLNVPASREQPMETASGFLLAHKERGIFEILNEGDDRKLTIETVLSDLMSDPRAFSARPVYIDIGGSEFTAVNRISVAAVEGVSFEDLREIVESHDLVFYQGPYSRYSELAAVKNQKERELFAACRDLLADPRIKYAMPEFQSDPWDPLPQPDLGGVFVIEVPIEFRNEIKVPNDDSGD